MQREKNCPSALPEFSGRAGNCNILFPFPPGGIPEKIPPFISGYHLEDFCGQGGISEVWKGRDSSGKEFAFRLVYKKKNPESWQDDRENFLLYGKNIPPHRNLAKLIDWGEKRDFCYFVLPLADNLFPGKKYLADTLGARLKKPSFFPFSSRQIFFIIRSVCSGVFHLHRNGFSHNDIKPENIFFAKKEPILADFGLGGPCSRKVHSGTAGYFPPWDPASGRERDLYAIGKILYALFSGKDPSEYPLLPEKSLLPGEILSFFNSLVYRACGRPGEKRFADVEDLGKELREGEKVFFPPGKK